MIKYFLFFCLCWYVVNPPLHAQQQFVHEYEWRMWEDSLAALVQIALHKKMGDDFSIKEDSLAVKVVVKMLLSDKALQFDFKEDNIFIKALHNEENTFRIVTWIFVQAPGYIIYRGVVQLKNSSKLIPLFDQVRFMDKLDNARQIDNMNTPDKWYGAFYYDMIPYTQFDKKQTQKYLLIGKRQDHVLYDAKVLDVITILPNNTIQFGDFFDVPRNLLNIPSSNRFVMLHKKNVGTVLEFNPTHNAVVFDVLDTEKSEERVKFNNKMYLIPTGLYQSFVYEKDFGWRFKDIAFEQMTPQEFMNRNKPKKAPTSRQPEKISY